jgi:hypothetical protein
MWLQTRTRQITRLLAPLAEVVGGEAAKGVLIGHCNGYEVEARPERGFPMSRPGTGSPNPPGQVDTFKLALSGVPGRAVWHCQSSAGSFVQDAISRFTAGGLLRPFQPGEFKFAGVDTYRDAHEKRGAKLTKATGVPIDFTPDKELQERLITAGLFDELSFLRWGAHPFLPKAEFTPPGWELVHLYKQSRAFARVEPKVTERLRAAGFLDFESVLDQRMAEANASNPGKLVLEVEVGKAKVPSPERFRELLDHAMRIAQINLEANPPTLRDP